MRFPPVALTLFGTLLLHAPAVAAQGLVPRDDGCVTCSGTPVCNCAANQQCFLIERDCHTCATVQCVDADTSSASLSASLPGPSASGTASNSTAGCISCPETAPTCNNCASNQQCMLSNRDCNTCATTKCVDTDAAARCAIPPVLLGALGGLAVLAAAA
ncbi:hypothetical protein MKEN_00292000 [Mycena kentingensis (nom. inval.)]|nr:hypothetical protein MKEN_00292000 [Mycena kentingensis (nom. inval.)]